MILFFKYFFKIVVVKEDVGKINQYIIHQVPIPYIIPVIITKNNVVVIEILNGKNIANAITKKVTNSNPTIKPNAYFTTKSNDVNRAISVMSLTFISIFF